MLRYDFEIYSVDNPSIAAGLKSVNGQTSQGHARQNKVVARFRHKQTSDAVASAPPIVRLFLEEAGFAPKLADMNDLEADSASDEEHMQRALVEQLTIALSNRALKKALGRIAKDSSFDVRAFISTVVSHGSKDESIAPEPECELPEYRSAETVMPRRPSQLRGRGLKSRARPI